MRAMWTDVRRYTGQGHLKHRVVAAVTLAVAAAAVIGAFTAFGPRANAQQGSEANPSTSSQSSQQSSAGNSSNQSSQQGQNIVGDINVGGAEAPELDWRECPEGVLSPEQRQEGYQCATAEVPLDYDEPDGETIELAVGKLPAEDQQNKVGTLFYNPGGPGGSGRIPPEITPELHERFDIVGFDPRGTNASTPLQCFDSPQQAISSFGQPFPINQTQQQRVFSATERGTNLCAQNAGPIISHMSTANVARDMDLLRRAVGDEKLTYLGYSYGTHLGEVYANLFPDKVRAMTLDAVLDPVEWTTGENPSDSSTPFTTRLGSFEGAQKALESFFEECASDDRCAFAPNGESPDQLQQKYDELLQRLRQGPIEISTPNGQSQEVTYQQFVGQNLSLLYSAQAAPVQAESLQQLYEASQPASQRARTPPVVDLPDVPTDPSLQQPPQQQGYLGLEWFSGVSCLDTANPSNQSAWPPAAQAADASAPGFGSIWTYNSLPCASWPATDEDSYSGPWNKDTANPILLVGNRQGDPATPYDDAQSTAKRLSDARLLTLDSYGHTATGGLSSCIDRSVERYLIAGESPPEGKVCQPDREPFDPVPQPMERIKEIPRP